MPCAEVVVVHLPKLLAILEVADAVIAVDVVTTEAADAIVTVPLEVNVAAATVVIVVDLETDLAEIAIVIEIVHVVADRNIFLSHILEGTLRLPSIFLVVLSVETT